MRRWAARAAWVLLTCLATLLSTTSASEDPAHEKPTRKESASSDFPIPKMTQRRTDVAPFTYTEVGAKIPIYTPGEKWGVQSEPQTKMQDPLPAKESIKHFIVPAGFRVELFASEPDIGGKPLAMNWDERGRLWLCETFDYPNEQQKRGEGRDRIRILEDTDGDGRADKFTVFAQQLSIPTSLTFARGGVIVFDGPETVFLKDNDGDDVADERTVLFGTWNQRDTHAGPSNMQYGLDGWIWGTQGYNDTKLTVGGVEHRLRQGIYRFKPDGSQFEFIRSTNNNTWGLGFDASGLVFASTANHNPSVFMPIANRYYERVRGWTPSLVLDPIADSHLFQASTDKLRQMDHFGGYTAAAGHSLYTARRYPQQYWNRTAFVCEPTGHLVGTFVLTPDGAGFRSTNPFNLVSSDDEWSAPTMAEVGPDGNVWIIDWYNYIVQHNPTPRGFENGKGQAYETDLRDKAHGRIYRIVYDGPVGEGKSREPRRSLAGATPDELVQALADDNLLWRRHAQRLLIERGKLDVLPALVAMVENKSVDAIGLNVGAIHAVWTMHGLGAISTEHPEAIGAVIGALAHPSAGVRRNAIQVLTPADATTDAIVEAGSLADTDPQVRLASFLAIADAPPRGELGATLVDLILEESNAMDRWLSEALVAAAATNSESFVGSLANDAKVDANHEKLSAAARIVSEHRARSGPYDDAQWFVAPLAKMPPRLASAVIAGVHAGWPQDKSPALAVLEDQLQASLKRLDFATQAQLVQLAMRWGSTRFEAIAREISGTLLARVEDNALSVDDRLAAARDLMTLRAGDESATIRLLDEISPRASTELATGLLAALSASESDALGTLLVDRLPAQTPAVRAAAISVLLSRPAWTTALVDGLASDRLAWIDLSLDQRRALSDHPDKPIRKRAEELLAAGGVLPNPDRRKVLDELLPLASQTGDAMRGKQVFIKQCAKCHVHGSEGTRIGPDLTGMAVHPKAELLENILDPSRGVEGNFRVFTVATTAGQVLTGLLGSESKTAIELFDAEGKKHSVLREDIDELVASPKSLMPEGFEKQVTPEELVDLLEFLTQRGKYLPLPLEKVATSVSTRGLFQQLDLDVERMMFAEWSPKQFGEVPFLLIDPREGRVANAIVLHSPQGKLSASMPRSVKIPCHAPAKAIHLLGGVSGWGHPGGEKGSVSMIVRLHYADGSTEDHELANGVHLADFIRRVDVPESTFAFDLGGRQLRYLSVTPKRQDPIDSIELLKGPDATAPVVMAVTVEAP